MCKVVLLVIFAVAFSTQLALAANSKRHLLNDFQHPVVKEYVNVSGIEYYITTGSLLWAHAYNDCLYRGMKLVSFENPGEYEDFSAWLNSSEFNWRWFWTSGMKERFNGTWHWMPSRTEITDFFWAPNEPDLDTETYDSCLSFHPGEGGMGDMDCVFNQLGHVCEPMDN